MTSQFEYNCFTEMCSGPEAGSRLRLIDFVHHSILGLRVIKRERREHKAATRDLMFFFHQEITRNVRLPNIQNDGVCVEKA